MQTTNTAETQQADLFNFAEHCHKALVIDKLLQLPQFGQFGDEFVSDFLQHKQNVTYG